MLLVASTASICFTIHCLINAGSTWKNGVRLSLEGETILHTYWRKLCIGILRVMYLSGIAVAQAFGIAPGVAAADSDETQFWLRYEYQQRVKDNMRAFGNLRYEELLDSDQRFGYWRRLAATGGVSYDLTKRTRFEGGLGLYQTWNPDVSDTFEARAWQAMTFDWPEVITARARWVVHHRFMLEERFQHTDDWDPSLRGRYRIAFAVPFNRHSIEPGAIFLPMSAEFFSDSVNGDQDPFSNKARLSFGLGYMLNKIWTVELRYAWQEQRDTTDGDNFEVDGHIIDLRLKTTVHIRDYLKSR